MIPKKIIVDNAQGNLYVVGTINRNVFKQASSYDRGTFYDEMGYDNIFVLNHRMKDGIYKWSRVFGDPRANDYFIQAQYYYGKEETFSFFFILPKNHHKNL